MELTTVDGRPFGNWLLRLTPEELEALKRTPRKRIQTLSLDALPRRGEYVFTKPNGMPYRSARGFTTACRRAGLSDVSPHVLRHTFATRLCENSVDLRLVQELGGWASLALVQRYAHVTPSRKAEAIEGLSRSHFDFHSAEERTKHVTVLTA